MCNASGDEGETDGNLPKDDEDEDTLMAYNLYAQPKAFREALAVHQAFGRLGFPMEGVFIGYQPDAPTDGDKLIVALRYEGRLRFTVACGIEGIEGWTHEEFSERWKKFAVENKHAPQEQLDRMWEESWVFAHKVEFAMGLRMKGIRWPNLDATLNGNTVR